MSNVATTSDESSEKVIVQAWSRNNSPDAPCR